MTCKPKKLLFGAVYGLLLAVTLLAVWQLSKSEPGPVPKKVWAGYTAGDYEYYYEDGRERLWEEDVLYFAETCLNGHPMLSDGCFYIHRKVSFPDAFMEDYSNAMYDPARRQEFIDAVNGLIPRLSELDDQQILFEMQRILAQLKDMNSTFQLGETDQLLPISVQPIYENDTVSFYTVMVPAEQEDMLFGKLTAINGVPITKIVLEMGEYISANNGYSAVHCMTNPYGQPCLLRKDMLQAVGVLDTDADSVELTVESKTGELTRSMKLVSMDERRKMEKIDRSVYYNGMVAYAKWADAPYWTEKLDESTLYVRFRALYSSDDQRLDQFLNLAVKALSDGEEPMKLVLDFRCVSNGYDCDSYFTQFIDAVNNVRTDGVYVLIDGGTSFSGLHNAHRLAKGIYGAVLVGTPAGQGYTIFSNGTGYTLPHSGHTFTLSDQCAILDSYDKDIAVRPEITVYQTIADFEDGVDTVLEFVMAPQFSKKQEIGA